MPNQKADPIRDVAAEIVADNPKIRRRMERLVNTMLDDAEYLLKFGTPADRAALMKQVIPALLRSMRGADANADEKAKAEAYARMIDALKGNG